MPKNIQTCSSSRRFPRTRGGDLRALNHPKDHPKISRSELIKMRQNATRMMRLRAGIVT